MFLFRERSSERQKKELVRVLEGKAGVCAWNWEKVAGSSLFLGQRHVTSDCPQSRVLGSFLAAVRLLTIDCQRGDSFLREKVVMQ